MIRHKLFSKVLILYSGQEWLDYGFTPFTISEGTQSTSSQSSSGEPMICKNNKTEEF